MSARAMAAVATLLAGTALAAAPARAQPLAERIARAGDGVAVMRYATRAGVCGDGRDAVARGDVLSVYPSMLSVGRWSGVRCQAGRAHVRLTVERGRVIAIRTSVSPEMPVAVSGRTDLGAVPAADAAAYLLEIVRRGEGRVARDAILPAAIADSATVWRALLEIARDDGRPREVRRRAIFWSAMDDEPEARRALRAMADNADLDEELRGETIFTLGQLAPTEEDEAFLRALYRRLPSQRLREKVIAGLGAGHARDSQRWLLELVTSEREPLEMRKQAMFWAAQGGDEGVPVEELVRLYPRLEDRRLKEHYAFVLSQRREEAAVTTLIEMARRDPDAEVRRKAFFWLGQSDDPRARQFLQEMIER